MILKLFFQIVLSWILGSSILKIFVKEVSAKEDIYQVPALLVDLLAVAEIKMSLKTGLMAGKILHNIFGLSFIALYTLIWYNEFGETSLITTLITGLISGLLNVISWTLLLVIIPASFLENFKGYYLKLVFIQNAFTITSLTFYNILF
jgi:hypothetical protein